ncbi:glutamate formimidoyltransferase [bacterium]|nr:glutamate formimidoyltransferase [bacterium]
MKKIVECVPNFSEGRNNETIDAISEAIRNTPGCNLLDVDPGKSTNRTVYTFVGNPESILEGALNSARVARKRIDMRTHLGEHPRMGAMDVCPFVPVANATMAECVDISKEFARRASEELGIPLFLYEEASILDYRKSLQQIREGEYEGLEEKLKNPKWKPDFGTTDFVPEWGATVTGARFFLIAYNVNLLSTSNQAHRIALNLREAGRGTDNPGRLKEVKGMGWYVDEYNVAQISANLTNYRVTPPHILFEEAKKDAAKLKIAVTGSEIVGLIPLDAMLMAADYYIKKEDLFVLEEDQKIRLVVERLGLNSVASFKANEKIIEYIIAEEKEEPLAGNTLRAFIQDVAARSSAPGGGSASAVIAAIGVGLGSMVAKLTYGVKKFESVDRKMREIIPQLHNTVTDLIPMVDADTDAFNDYVNATRLPKQTKEEQTIRLNCMQEGLKKAIEVPLKTMKIGDSAWEAMTDAAKHGNPATKSDLAVGARALEVGIWGAFQNVMINLPTITDEKYKKDITNTAERIVTRAKEKLSEILDILVKR